MHRKNQSSIALTLHVSINGKPPGKTPYDDCVANSDFAKRVAEIKTDLKNMRSKKSDKITYQIEVLGLMKSTDKTETKKEYINEKFDSVDKFVKFLQDRELMPKPQGEAVNQAAAAPAPGKNK